MGYVMHKEIYEIFKEMKKHRKRDEIVEFVKEHKDSMPFKDILRGIFDDTIQWNLPEGEPPYTPNKPESVPSTLRKRHLDFKYFVKGLTSSETLPPVKRELKFISLLESIHPEDAKIVVKMKQKKSPYKGLTKTVVMEALPGLIKS